MGKNSKKSQKLKPEKKLAEKKEERHIEDGIHQIKKEHEEAIRDVNFARQQHKDLTSKLNESIKSIAESESQLNVEKETRAKVEKELLEAKEQVKLAVDRLISANNENNKVKLEMSGLMREFNHLKKQMEDLSAYNQHLLNELNFVSEKIPNIIRLKNINGKMEIVFNKSNYEKIIKTVNSSDELTTSEKDSFSSFTGLDFGHPIIKERPSELKNGDLIEKNEKPEIIIDRNQSR